MGYGYLGTLIKPGLPKVVILSEAKNLDVSARLRPFALLRVTILVVLLECFRWV